MNKELMPSAARAAGTYYEQFTADGHVGGKFVVDITALTGTLDFSVEFLGAGNKWVAPAAWALAQKSGTGTSVLTIYPGITGASNVSVLDVLGDTCRVKAVVGTGPITFQVGVDLKR